MTDTGQSTRDILQTYGPAAGLELPIRPFATGEHAQGENDPRGVTDATDASDLLRTRWAANPFMMAPMAGVSDTASRLMARAGGAAVAYSEMVSVAGIHFGGDKTWELVIPQDPEPDLAVQLFGSKPEQFREAAEQVYLRLGKALALLDINMACPVPKVAKKGEGAALMDDPARAYKIVVACREGIEAASQQLGLPPVPVTCKIRRGVKTGHELAPVFAEAMEQAGAAAVAVHGRFADQFYRGEADWGTVKRTTQIVKSIPVIASGDIATPEAAARAMGETGASAVMIARGTYGNPWIFRDAQRILAGQEPEEHDLTQRLAALALHVRLLEATGAHMARARSLASWYLKGIPDASAWRNRAMQCVTADDFLALIDEVGEFA